MPLSDVPDDEVERMYGHWAQLTPADAVELFAGYSGPWWMSGGWAIEAFTGVARPHSDTDVSVPRADLPALRRHLAGRVDLWAADQETLRVLLPGDIGYDDHLLPASCENVRARHGGTSPWLFDIVLMTTEGDRWTYKRDARTNLPLDQIVWVKDGVPYLRPEVQLLHKAPGLRPKDQADFETALPLLDDRAVTWLREAITRTHPGHPWLLKLGRLHDPQPSADGRRPS